MSNFTKKNVRSLRDAWSRIVKEFEEQATWHLRIADMFKSRICESLLSFEKTLRKDHKGKQQPVEKAYAKYCDVANAMYKVLPHVPTRYSSAATDNRSIAM